MIKKKNMNKIKNNILSLLQNDNKDITNTNNTIENEIQANYIFESNNINKEKEKEKKSNKINNKIIKRLISTPKKECETNFKLILMQDQIKTKYLNIILYKKKKNSLISI